MSQFQKSVDETVAEALHRKQVEELEAQIANGESGSMQEVALGATIADRSNGVKK